MSVTAIEVAPGIDPEALRTVARERFQVAVAGGLGPLSGRVFRIGHMGDVNEAMILGCLAGVEAALHVQGVACGRERRRCRGRGARRRDALRPSVVRSRPPMAERRRAQRMLPVWPSE